MKLRRELLLAELEGPGEIFIYGFGIAGRWLAGQFSGRVSGFIDTDEKKRGSEFDGLKVLSLADAKAKLSFDSKIVNTVIDIQDVLDLIEQLPHSKSIPLGIFLESGIPEAVPGIIETIDFLRYSLEAVKKCHEGFFDKNSLFLRSVDVVITERCSLKCKDCSNLMQYYTRPMNVAKNDVLGDFEKLMQTVDHIFEVRLIGGEPFMNKQIYEIISDLVKSPKISRLVIYTNAMIPFTEAGIDVLKHSKIVLSITDYGALAKNTKSNVDILSDKSIPYRIHPPENWTDSGTISDFQRSDEENQRLFKQCCGKNLLTLSNGRLYRCPFSANADRLHAIPADERNYVQIDCSATEIRRYVRELVVLPACNYCKGRSFDAPQIIPAVQTNKPLAYQSFQKSPSTDFTSN